MQIRKYLLRILRQSDILLALKAGAMSWSTVVPERRDEYQLERLNKTWKEAVANIPFYAMWKQRHQLPDEITSFEEYAKWPILTKRDIQEYAKLFKRKTTKPVHWSVTGGATGEPLHFGTFRAQGKRTTAELLLARAGLGVLPGDKILLFWGHRHFYGYGFSSKVRFFVRRCKDWLNNTCRLDACNLSEQYLVFVGRKMLRQKPEVVIAYSASLLAFCRYMREEGLRFQRLGIRCIICSAGPLSLDERKEISTFFAAPVYMEYGSMEGGLLAYMAKDGRYVVHHNTRILQTQFDGVGHLNLVTSLYSDYLPLFRYKIGDYLSGCEYTPDGRVLTIGEVWGRASDLLTLPSGQMIHSYTFMVLAESFAKILAYQLVKKGSTYILSLKVSSSLTEDEKAYLYEKAYSIVPELRNVDLSLEETGDLIKAPSGKIRLFVDLSQKS